MTVKELIEKLELAPEDVEVRREDDQIICRVEIILTETQISDHVTIY